MGPFTKSVRTEGIQIQNFKLSNCLFILDFLFIFLLAKVFVLFFGLFDYILIDKSFVSMTEILVLLKILWLFLLVCYYYHRQWRERKRKLWASSLKLQVSSFLRSRSISSRINILGNHIISRRSNSVSSIGSKTEHLDVDIRLLTGVLVVVDFHHSAENVDL